MAKTGAERQAEYRAQRARQDSADRRINTWISKEAYLALEALSERYGVTRRDTMELLLMGGFDKPAKLESHEEFFFDSGPRGEGVLLRNDLPVVTLPAIEELHTHALLRNDGRGAGTRKKQSISTGEAKLSQSDGQFELGL